MLAVGRQMEIQTNINSILLLLYFTYFLLPTLPTDLSLTSKDTVIPPSKSVSIRFC